MGAAALLATLLVVVPATAAPVPEAAAAGDVVELAGHGWGHGRGLGQWGALGYAVDAGWGSARILDHYYGGTAAGSIGSARTSVELRAHTGAAVAFVSERGGLRTSADDALPGGRVPHPALRVERAGPGQWRVYDGAGCAGPWAPRPALVTRGSVDVLPAVPASEDHRDLLQVCEGGGSRWLRGSLRVVDADGTSHLVNRLPMESYLRGVLPRESPASWGDAGGGRGLQALRAQAVAARSYAAAERRASWAKTCDTTSCQVYGGHAVQSPGAPFRLLEDPRTDRAVAGTAGVVRLRAGAVVRTEFSSSTGGWTAGGTFPAVPDAGDAYAGNPHHAWRTTVPVAAIEAAYGRGGLLAVEVTSRNGLGEDGGRVLAVRVRLTGGTVTVSGDDFRRSFGLRSNWFRVVRTGGDRKTEPIGGYRLGPDGTLTAFGATAPASGDTRTPSGLARAVALGGRANRVGYVLDGHGHLYPFNGARAVADAPSWPSWDIARDVVVRADGRSGYVLDGLGAVHPFGGAPPVAAPGFDPSADAARRLVLRADGASGYVVRSDGAVAPFGGAPPVTTSALGAGRVAVGLVLGADGRSGQVVDDAGTFHPFGAGPLPDAVAGGLTGTVAVEGRPDGRSAYLVSSSGALGAAGAARLPSNPPARATRDLALLAEPSGYVLDGFGGLAPFGGAPAAHPTAYWGGQDVARRAVVRPDGAGYVLDAFGGIHPFATDATPAPPVPSGVVTWPGWAIARDLALLPGSPGAGYVLDGFGGLHPFGGAPAPRSRAYWAGEDVARRVVLDPAGTGGYVVDRSGGLHRFAVGSAELPPRLTGTPYWPGQDRIGDVVLTGATAGYVVDDRGAVVGFGGRTGAGSWRSSGSPAVVGAGLGIRGWVVYADAEGGLHTAPETAPATSPTAGWPGWPIARDVAVRSR